MIVHSLAQSQGCSAVADKLTALLHMIRLESGSSLPAYCDSVVALVTDQGTEHLISDAGPISPETFLQDDQHALNISKQSASVSESRFLEDDSVMLGRLASEPGNKSVIDLISDDDGEDDCLDENKVFGFVDQQPSSSTGAVVPPGNLSNPGQETSIPRLSFGIFLECTGARNFEIEWKGW